MVKYMIVQLCDTSVSYCHYHNPRTARRLIPLDTLRQALRYAMCENLTVQYLYPEYRLPHEYVEVMESVEHAKVAPAGVADDADILIFSSLEDAEKAGAGSTVSISLSMREVYEGVEKLTSLLRRVARLNIALTDHHLASDADMLPYRQTLDRLADVIAEEYGKGRRPQCNLLTDRLMLQAMNNCGAGDESITLAPDGHFYICPAFYLNDAEPVGTPENGVTIANQHLYTLDYAPICRTCDAWQCRRCVWLNKERTLEVNTPGRGQCITAHAERAASLRLKQKLQEAVPGIRLSKIEQIDYNDPFEKIER